MYASNEIRLRNCKKDLMQKVANIGRLLNEKETTGVIKKLINNYQGDQDTIKQLAIRNTQLHQAIKKYYDQQDEVLALIKLLQQGATGNATAMLAYTKRLKIIEKKYRKKAGTRK